MLLAVFSLLAAAPTPLVSGAVRDQFGEPIAGAVVLAGSQQTRTAADGTFVLHSGALSVRIECRYCRPQTVSVDADGTVAAIVDRYDALSSSVPTARDIAALPYARAESIVSLRPFTVLTDSKGIIPGPRTSLYGTLTPGLLIDAGIPMYEATGGVSPYRTIPGFSTADVSVRDIEDAPLYGDLAGGGMFAVNELPASGSGALALAGSQRGVRAWTATQPFSAALAAYADPFENTRRADAAAIETNPDLTLEGNAFAASDTSTNNYVSLASSVSAANVTLSANRALHPYVTLWAQRASYAAQPYVTNASWSDSAIVAGVHTDGATQFFADAAAQTYSAAYGYGVPAFDSQAGTTQFRVDAGARGITPAVSWQALVSAFDVEEREGEYAEPQRGLAPSVRAAFDLSTQWTVLASADDTWNVLPQQRIGQDRLQLEYSDLRRVKLGVSAVHEWTSPGTHTLASSGVYAAWQIAPALSLRAWGMHFSDYTSASPGSAWLAYRPASGITADLIWRRDLLDALQREHVDASIALPLHGGFALFAATEERGGRHYASIGLRTAQP